MTGQIDLLVTSALALVARRQVQLLTPGRIWIVPDGNFWCDEMATALNALLKMDLISIGPMSMAVLTATGEAVLRDMLPAVLHPQVFQLTSGW